MRGNSPSRATPGGEPNPIYETRKRAPIRHRCPDCGEWGHRKRTRSREVIHLAHKRPAFWILIYRGNRSGWCSTMARVEGNADHKPLRFPHSCLLPFVNL